MNVAELERRAKKAGTCDEYNCCEQLQDAIEEFMGGSFMDREDLLRQIADLEAELFARSGPVTDHLHATHELPDLDYCSICMGEFLDAYVEPADPKAPSRDWYQDEHGYVKVDA